MWETASEYIRLLELQPHPEGGYFRETYRDERSFSFVNGEQGFTGKKNFSTAIFFLLERGNFSAFHRIRSDEVWHFYAGDPLEVIEIDENGGLHTTIVGNRPEKGEVFQYVVRAGRWFGSRVAGNGTFSLVGCTVSPSFDFADFEMAEREKLIQEFPQHVSMIYELTR
jgi:hypothetical protein